MTDPLIHPDCADPEAEFEGRLDQLINEAREAGIGTARLRYLTHKRTDDEMPTDDRAITGRKIQ